MDSLEKKESPESAGPEITKKMVRERTTKKKLPSKLILKKY